MDIIDNVIPNIDGEEAKVEWEPRKMLGSFDGESIQLADFGISAHTNRVAVSDGHIGVRLIRVGQQSQFGRGIGSFELRSSLQRPPRACLPRRNPVIVVRTESDRPQPRLDRMTGGGMTTVVGRLRPDRAARLQDGGAQPQYDSRRSRWGHLQWGVDRPARAAGLT